MCYHLIELDRIKGLAYPKIEGMIIQLVRTLDGDPLGAEPNDGAHVCLDATGAGAIIRDYLLQHKRLWQGTNGGGKHGKKLYPVVFTGGEAARHNDETGNDNISKNLIVQNMKSLMQHGRLDFRPGLELLDELYKEMDFFKYERTPSGKVTMNAPPNAHDDMITAIDLCLIIGESQYNTGQHGVHRPSSAGAQDLDMRLPGSQFANFGSRIPGSQ